MQTLILRLLELQTPEVVVVVTVVKVIIQVGQHLLLVGRA
jgi:hypothetical protein